MATRKTQPALHASAADTSAAVDVFMATLEHPHKDLIEAIRTLILAVDAGIADGIKWNAPSYRTTEYFATTNLREKAGVGVILHLGAKVRDIGPEQIQVDDPHKLLKWLGRDRAMIVFKDGKDFSEKTPAFEHIVRSWLVHV